MSTSNYLEVLDSNHEVYKHVTTRMRQTIMDHDPKMKFKDYNIQKVYKVDNPTLKQNFERKRVQIEAEIGRPPEIWEAFHGSPAAVAIVQNGFQVSQSSNNNMFGRGVYFAPQSSKSNQYTLDYKSGCEQHSNWACTQCTRRMLLCLCIMGKQFQPHRPTKDVPPGCHSVVADPTKNEHIEKFLKYPEYCLLEGDQILPYVLVEYTLSQDEPDVARLALEEAIKVMISPSQVAMSPVAALLGIMLPGLGLGRGIAGVINPLNPVGVVVGAAAALAKPNPECSIS